MNGIPDISIEEEDDQANQNQNSDDENLTNTGDHDKQRALCAPYIQIFKNGQRIFQTLQKK